MSKLQQTLKRFREASCTHWNPSERFEPIGCKVLLLFEDATTEEAYRKSPVESKECPKTYFRISDDSIIEKQSIGWQYL